MSSREKVVKSELSGVLDTFMSGKKKALAKSLGKDEGDTKFLNIIEFIDKFNLLPQGLFPVQRFIVKMYYNVPLNDTLPEDVRHRIKITDRTGRETGVEMTEVEYLEYLYSQKRCNLRKQDGKDRRELILVIGRRSGKSMLSSIFAAYEMYKLLCRGNPQSYYGAPHGNEIRVLCIANDKEQASIVYGEMLGHVEAVDYFKTSVANSTQSYIRFRTENDRQKYGNNGKATIVATFKSSIAKGLRGRGIMCAILDEIAFFVDDGKCSRLSSNILTDFGFISLDQILTGANVDRSRIGWTDIDPVGIVQENGHRTTATRIYYGGVQKTRKIVTKSKYSIEPTPEHRLKVMGPDGNIDWKYVRDIIPGDFIGVNRSTNLWPEKELDCSQFHRSDFVRKTQVARIPLVLDPNLGEFLGILCGDGTWKSSDLTSLVQVTGGCEQFLPVVQDHFARYFDSFNTSRKPVHDHNTCEVSPWKVTKESAPFRSFLNSLGYRLEVTKSTKSIPWSILKSPKPIVASFLRGLFETDGGLEQNGRTISFTTASKQLAEETQLLLLNFGVTSSIYWKKNKNYPDRFYYYLRIIGHESRRIFRDEIGFITDRKNADLNRGVDFGRDASNTIPHQFNRLRKILESIPKGSTAKKGDDARTRITKLISSSADHKRRSTISYDSARRLVSLGKEVGADSVLMSELESICDKNYFWDPVVSVEESEGEVADLFVPDGNEYVAQGMTNHNSSAERVYRAIVPSIAQFSPKDPDNKHKPMTLPNGELAPSDGRVILISSPDAKEGFFYRQYQIAMSNSKAASNMLMIQAPTWEVNPTLSPDYYETEYYKAPASFMTEHGAEFSDRVRGWIEDYRVLADCIIPDLRPQPRGIPRDPHFAGFDLGLTNDGSAIALTRINEGRIELVYHEIWYPKMSWKEANPHLPAPLTDYANHLEHVERLDMSEIAEWLLQISKRFYISKGVFDQWSGIPFEQELHRRNLKQFEMRNFFVSHSSQAYQTFKMFMYNKQLALYDYPTNATAEDMDQSKARHSPLITELLELQATSAGKNMVTVEAPKVVGKHDDQSDALARSVMLAGEYVQQNPGILDIRRSAQMNRRLPPPMDFKKMRFNHFGGTSPERFVSRKRRF